MQIRKTTILLLIVCINTQNLFINPGFQLETVPNSWSQFYNNLTGWSCYDACQLFCCRTCNDKCVDIQASVSQLVNIQQKGRYRLIVDYYPPWFNSVYKTLRTFLNSSIVTQLTTNQPSIYTDPKKINITLNLERGLNNISMGNDWFGGNHHGFSLINLQLSRLTIDPNNLIVNGDFLGNAIPSATNIFLTSLQGWSCHPECQLHCCNVLPNQYRCSQHCIDLDATGIIYTSLTQNINVQMTGRYNLIVKYYDPYLNTQNKTLKIHLNNNIIFQLWAVQAMNISRMKTLDLTVVIQKGMNNLTFSMGGGTPSYYGFIIAKVQLFFVEALNEGVADMISKVLENQLTETAMSAPGFRIVFSKFAYLFANFDRFQLYIFHNRTYSQNMVVFLKKVYQNQQLELSFLKQFAKLISQSMVNYIDTWKMQFSFKKDHLDSVELSLVQQRIGQFKDGFVQNQLDYMIYKVVACCLMFALLKIIFHILFNHPVSLIFRKYYFFGTLVLLILDGSIQELIFFLSLEAKLLISFTFQQKIINSFIIFVMFIVILLSVSLFLFFYSQYNWLIKYLQQNGRPRLAGILASTIDRGIMCMLLGFAHRLLIEQPNDQLFALAFIQITWIFVRLRLNKIDSYQMRYLVLIWNFQGCLRVFMILSFYLYSQYVTLRVFIGQLHADLITSYISLMIIESFISLILIIQQIFQSFKRIYIYSSTKTKGQKRKNKLNVCKKKDQNIKQSLNKDQNNHNDQQMKLQNQIRRHPKDLYFLKAKSEVDPNNASIKRQNCNEKITNFQRNKHTINFSPILKQNSLKIDKKYQRNDVIQQQNRDKRKIQQIGQSIINFQRNKRKIKASPQRKQGQLMIIDRQTNNLKK